MVKRIFHKEKIIFDPFPTIFEVIKNGFFLKNKPTKEAKDIVVVKETPAQSTNRAFLKESFSNIRSTIRPRIASIQKKAIKVNESETGGNSRSSRSMR